MDAGSKHLKVASRRARFEKKKRYGGGGATLKRSRFYASDSSWELEIHRPENDDFLLMTTEVDELYDFPVGCPHGLASNRLVEFLADLSEKYIPRESIDRTGKNIATFSVPGIHWKTGKLSVARQKARFDRLQLGVGGSWTLVNTGVDQRYVQTRACKIFTRISDTPLDSIMDPSLLDKYSMSCSASSKGTYPDRAHVNNNSSSSCWSPPLTNLESHFLQVDLCCNCEVTHISTQGRFPPLLEHPYNPICKFTGAQIMNEQHSNFRQWVWKYEVVARVDSGRAWFSLGVFDGNRDMTTEIAHKLLSPVKCRYLRFHVLGYDRVPAMRVGAYGIRPGGNTQQTFKENQMVQYRFERIEEGMSLDRVPVGSKSADASHWFHCKLCYAHTTGPCSCNKRHRHLRRLAARKTVSEAYALMDFSRKTADPFAKNSTNASVKRSSEIKGSPVNLWAIVGPQFQSIVAHRANSVNVEEHGWILV